MCNKRGDEEADKVRTRVEGSPSDLHAADARYHDKCRKLFMNPKNIPTSSHKPGTSGKDLALKSVLDTLRGNANNSWTSVQLHQLYTENGGTVMSRKQLMINVK